MQLMQAAERQNKPRTVAFSRLLVCTLVHTGARFYRCVPDKVNETSPSQATLAPPLDKVV